MAASSCPVAAPAPLLQVVAQQVRGFLARQRLHLAQLALDRPGAHPGLLDLVAGLGELLLRRIDHVAELSELGLDRAHGAPDLALMCSDRPCAHTPLTAVY